MAYKNTKMRTIFNRIQSFLINRKNLKLKLGLFVFLLLFMFVTSLQPAFAEGMLDTFVNDIILAIAKIFLVLANFFIGLTIFALRYFIELAAYNNHTLAETVVLGWTMVRDVANMFFVVVLLVIAFGTILGLDQYEWQKLTVKLVLAAIFINFSKLIAGVIIDAAHVFTITFLNAVVATAGGNIINMFKMDTMLSFASDKIANPSADDLVLQVLGGSIAAFIFSFVALLTIGAYTVIMLSRVLILWVLIILSPLAYIFSVLPSTKKWASEYWKEFTNYVIAAPIMVFFLWLAFATMGSGNINQTEIAEHVTIEKAKIGTLEDQGSRAGELSSSLSAVTEWESMASFFIAVAFLFVGLQQVGKLGIIGGTLATQAAGLGVTVSKYATGYKAAGYLGGVAVKKAKEGALGVGKIAVSPITRTARSVRAQASILGSKIQTTQAQAAKRLAKKGFFGRRLASIVEIGTGRKEKKVKDWEDAAENAKRFKDGLLGTSSLAGGQAKLEWSMRLQGVEELKGVKSAQKAAEMSQKLTGEKSFFNRYAKFQDINKLISEGTVEKEGLEKQESLAAAKRKAEAYKKQGDYVKANQVITEEYARQAKITNDPFNNMSWELLMARASTQNPRVDQARKNYNADPTNDKLKRQYHDELQRNVGLNTAMFNQGSTVGEAGFAQALNSVGWTEPITDDNKVAAFLSVNTGRLVKNEKTAIQDATTELENAYGGKDEAQQAIRLMSDSLKKTAMNGGINMMGIIGSDVVDGEVVYKINTKQNVDTGSYPAERQDLRRLESASGFANVKIDSIGNTRIVGFTDKRAGQFAEMFRGKSKLYVDNTHSAFLKTLNDAEVNESNANEYENLYTHIASTIADENALKSFMNQTSTLVGQVNALKKDPKDQINAKVIWAKAGRKP